MLQNIREKVQGTTAKIVVGLIVFSFSIFGIESILVGGGGNEVAEVNGDPISPQELQQALDTQKRRLIAMLGPIRHCLSARISLLRWEMAASR